MGDADNKNSWITEDALTHLGAGVLVLGLFLANVPGQASLLSGILSILGILSVFLMIAGTVSYFTKQDLFTAPAGFALAFLITLFFGPAYVIRPIHALLSILSSSF